LPWRARAKIDASGFVVLQVPYATDARNGDATVQNARWSIGTRSGKLTVPERAVLGGESVSLE
jgi:hypothetical protein